jgi:hypothetical protein
LEDLTAKSAKKALRNLRLIKFLRSNQIKSNLGVLGGLISFRKNTPD